LDGRVVSAYVVTGENGVKGGGGGGGGLLSGEGGHSGGGDHGGGGGGAGGSWVEPSVVEAFSTVNAETLGNGRITFTFLRSELADWATYKIHWGGDLRKRISALGGRQLQVADSDGTAAQEWTASSPDEAGYRQLISARGLCLTTAHHPSIDASQEPCVNGQPQQRWKYEGGALIAADGSSLDANPNNQHLVAVQPTSAVTQQWGLEEVWPSM
jgi:hypothetical protein